MAVLAEPGGYVLGSTNLPPDTSTHLLAMVPPVNADGAAYSGVWVMHYRVRPEMPSPTDEGSRLGDDLAFTNLSVSTEEESTFR